MPTRISPCCARAPLWCAAVAALIAVAPIAGAQDVEVVEQIPKSGYEVQQELIETIHSTQDLINAIGVYTYVDPSMVIKLNEQLYAIKMMSAGEIESLAMTDTSLWNLREEIERMEQLIADDNGSGLKDPAPGAGYGPTAQSSANCPTGGRYDGNPPGPCSQTGFSGVVLSDTGYPAVCPFSTPPAVLVVGRTTFAIARFAASIAERFCRQSVFGNNTSTACLVTEIILVVAKTAFDVLDGCNGKRGDAELIVAYSRAGEIFFSNKRNFEAQDAAMKANFDKVVSTDSVLSALVITEKNNTLMELDQGFSGTEERLVQLETEAIQNSQRLAKVLDEQRTIMQELGIEHLYRDPNTQATGISGYTQQQGFLLLQPAKPDEPDGDNADGSAVIDDTSLLRRDRRGLILERRRSRQR